MLTVIALALLALATVGLLALASKVAGDGFIGGVFFLHMAQSILEGAARVAGAILKAAESIE